jgi:hypothetical protein
MVIAFVSQHRQGQMVIQNFSDGHKHGREMFIKLVDRHKLGQMVIKFFLSMDRSKAKKSLSNSPTDRSLAKLSFKVCVIDIRVAKWSSK